jgi:hypothetical protein
VGPEDVEDGLECAGARQRHVLQQRQVVLQGEPRRKRRYDDASVLGRNVRPEYSAGIFGRNFIKLDIRFPAKTF